MKKHKKKKHLPIGKVLCEECTLAMRHMPKNSIDAIVTDPPYNLGFMNQEWDVFDDKQRRVAGTGGTEAPFAKHAKALTPKRNKAYQEWCEAWARAALRVAKPGAYLLAFGGTRTYHRLACAIEDAGWEIRDCIMWVYSSGFPKSLDVSKAIDKKVGIWRGRAGVVLSENGSMSAPNYVRTSKKDPITDAAKQWEGWGTALKPAYEPIIIARKPLEGTVAENIQKWGTGALNIDGTRIMPKDQERDDVAYRRLSRLCASLDTVSVEPSIVLHVLERSVSALRSCNTDNRVLLHNVDDQDGKWPVGVVSAQRLFSRLVSNVDVCALNWSSIPDFFDDCPVCRHFCDEQLHAVRVAARESVPSLLDALSDMCRGTHVLLRNQHCQCIDHLSTWGVLRLVSSCLNLLYINIKQYYSIYLTPPQGKIQGRWPANLVLDDSEEVKKLFPQIKSTPFKMKRNNDPEKNIQFMVSQKRMPNGGYADSGSAARFFYCAKASRRERESGLQVHVPCTICGKTNTHRHKNDKGHWVKCTRNVHPTVKPLSLMKYLCKLVTPPNGIILDPFCGSGSTLVAACRGKFRYIGIDKDRAYCTIAEQRVQAEQMKRKSLW